MILSPQNTPFTTKSAGTSYELMIQRMTKTKVKASNIIGQHRQKLKSDPPGISIDVNGIFKNAIHRRQ